MTSVALERCHHCCTFAVVVISTDVTTVILLPLGVTTVLTMAFLGLDNRNDLPKVSYSTALDYFVAVCFVSVMASIIEVTINILRDLKRVTCPRTLP